MNTTLYSCGRGGGKTTWMLQQINDVVQRGERVAIVTHVGAYRTYTLPDTDVYSEKTFERARGCRYDHIFIDNADLFEHDPAELCAQVAPGVPVTMTYTPDERSTLRILATPPDSPVSEPTLSQRDQEYLAMLLAVRTGESLKRIMESGIVQSAVAAGLLWKMTSGI